MVFDQQADRLLRALERWRALWAKTLATLQHEARRCLGVAQHISSPEYLSRKIVQAAKSAGPMAAQCDYLRWVPTTSQRNLHIFLRDHISSD